jgi:SAM-dependent methyltransferase
MRSRLVFKDNRVFISGVEFRLEVGEGSQDSDANTLFLHKTAAQLQMYEGFWESRISFQPQRILELGIWEGGSLAFWFEYFRPAKHVAVDILPAEDLPALQQYMAGSDRRDRIATYWSVDQADAETLRGIVDREFDGPLDLVIDDASHLYGPTKTSFETLFPVLKPGGLYIIEDWPWGYQDRFLAPDHPWAGEEPLTKLVGLLQELAGTSASVARSLFMNTAFVAVERGETPALDLAPFHLDAGHAAPSRRGCDRSRVPELVAIPNPAPTGTSTISWNSGNHNEGFVYTRRHGCDEVLFARGASGSVEATWISENVAYEFRLYGDAERRAFLKSIVVSREPPVREVLAKAVRDPLTLQGVLLFRCNICGEPSLAPAGELERERSSCRTCSSTVRWRSVIRALSLELFGRALVLDDFPVRRDLVGLGLSDWDGYARQLAQKFTYTNTYYQKEPRLDIANIEPRLEGTCDFLIASDVFEHVAPPVERAFINARRLLKPNGCLIMSVPYSADFVSTREHFPELHDFHISDSGQGPVLRNVTRDGRIQTFDNLYFHGGDGATLEMRLFSETGLRRQFENAGMSCVFHSASDPNYGVLWQGIMSYPIAGRKSATPPA